jgi:hypothetical protein
VRAAAAANPRDVALAAKAAAADAGVKNFAKKVIEQFKLPCELKPRERGALEKKVDKVLQSDRKIVSMVIEPERVCVFEAVAAARSWLNHAGWKRTALRTAQQRQLLSTVQKIDELDHARTTGFLPRARYIFSLMRTAPWSTDAPIYSNAAEVDAALERLGWDRERISKYTDSYKAQKLERLESRSNLQDRWAEEVDLLAARPAAADAWDSEDDSEDEQGREEKEDEDGGILPSAKPIPCLKLCTFTVDDAPGSDSVVCQIKYVIGEENIKLYRAHEKKANAALEGDNSESEGDY